MRLRALFSPKEAFSRPRAVCANGRGMKIQKRNGGSEIEQTQPEYQKPPLCLETNGVRMAGISAAPFAGNLFDHILLRTNGRLGACL